MARKAYTITSRLRRGGNLLKVSRVLEIERLAYAGDSQREIAAKLGVEEKTVRRYFPRDAKCPCGKLLVEHKGWCSVRYKKSQKRQAIFPPRKR